MASLIPADLAAYIHEHTTPETELFERLRAETHDDLEDPQMQVGRVEGAFLRLIVQITGARRILEIGTFSGYSGLSMASGLPADGKLITCDLDPVATAVAQRYFAASPWGDKIDFRLGPAADTIAALAAEGARFDLVFLDADKESYVDYFDAVLPMVEIGGVILADNTLWSGKVLAPTEPSDHGIANFNRHVRDDDRVEQVMLSVRDGITLCRRVR